MIITIANLKGGTGKSTLAVNLADAFSRADLRVLVVEADPSVHTVSHWAGIREEDGLPAITTIRKDGKLNATLEDMARAYDVVLVDTPGKDSVEARSALVVSQLALLPAQPTQADLDATTDMLELTDEIEMYNPGLKALVVLNRASTHSLVDDVRESREFLEGRPIARTVIHDRRAFKTVLSDGKTVLDSKDVKARDEILALTEEIRQKVGTHA